MKNIKLHSRDHYDIYLKHIRENQWVFMTSDKDEWIINHLRIGLSENDDSIHFIDPPGGPFLDVGSKLSDGQKTYLIEKIIDDGCDFKFTLSEI